MYKTRKLFHGLKKSFLKNLSPYNLMWKMSESPVVKWYGRAMLEHTRGNLMKRSLSVMRWSSC